MTPPPRTTKVEKSPGIIWLNGYILHTLIIPADKKAINTTLCAIYANIKLRIVKLH